MNIFHELDLLGHEQVVFGYDKKTGLKAIIGIHNTKLGPALGGVRLRHYTEEADAIRDVLRLSRGMTYKNAAAGLSLGGGKAVMLAQNHTKTPELLYVFAKMVHSLGGRYITAPDMNTSSEDMVVIRKKTPFVASLPVTQGGSGDPSPFTALGTFEGIKASVAFKLGQNDLKDIRVAVQGLGHVGFELCKLLAEAGVRLLVGDVIPERVREAVRLFKAKPVDLDEIYKIETEVFAPCAVGGILNDTTIPRLRCQIVAGAANNQLEYEKKHSEMLHEHNILYAPDFVINAGGVINISFEIGRPYDAEAAKAKVQTIYHTLSTLYQRAKEHHLTTYRAAIALAEARLASS